MFWLFGGFLSWDIPCYSVLWCFLVHLFRLQFGLGMIFFGFVSHPRYVSFSVIQHIFACSIFVLVDFWKNCGDVKWCCMYSLVWRSLDWPTSRHPKQLRRAHHPINKKKTSVHHPSTVLKPSNIRFGSSKVDPLLLFLSFCPLSFFSLRRHHSVSLTTIPHRGHGFLWSLVSWLLPSWLHLLGPHMRFPWKGQPPTGQNRSESPGDDGSWGGHHPLLPRRAAWWKDLGQDSVGGRSFVGPRKAKEQEKKKPIPTNFP